MVLENKLGITDSSELARVEEKISKSKALELFETGLLDTLRLELLRDWQTSIDISLMRYTTSLEKYEL